MFFLLCFMTEAVVIVLSLKWESKKSISKKFHLKDVNSGKDDLKCERFAKISENIKDDNSDIFDISEICWFEFVFMKIIIVCCIIFVMRFFISAKNA